MPDDGSTAAGDCESLPSRQRSGPVSASATLLRDSTLFTARATARRRFSIPGSR